MSAKKHKSSKQPKRSFDPTLGITLGAVALLVGGIATALVRGRRDVAGTDTGEHVPTDLMGDTHPDGSERAVDAFRPDPTAPVPEAMRESLRPATGPAPSLVLDRGNMNNQTASANA